MKERPILFSAPMVRALLAGTKTQTRRVVNFSSGPHTIEQVISTPDSLAAFVRTRCPYGQPGDRLWVRENGWERPERSPSDMREGADTWPPYEYDAAPVSTLSAEDMKAWKWKRRPSIHMPRWASRITLEVVAVRVERLQEINETDAMAEGVDWKDRAGLAAYTAGKLYRTLWEQINGPGSWAANPWVWVVEFRRLAR